MSGVYSLYLPRLKRLTECVPNKHLVHHQPDYSAEGRTHNCPTVCCCQISVNLGLLWGTKKIELMLDWNFRGLIGEKSMRIETRNKQMNFHKKIEKTNLKIYIFSTPNTI